MEMSEYIYGNVDIILDENRNRRAESENDHIYDDPHMSQDSGGNIWEEVPSMGRPGVDSSGMDISGRRSSRQATVCWVLLCVLLLAGIIGLVFYHITLKTSYTNLIKERDQLETSYNNLTKERNQIKRERDELQKIFSAFKQAGTAGWTPFQSSWYYISSEVKSWEHSRQDCMNRGADLVIINNIREQTFLTKLKKSLWIGLTDKDIEGTWKWVDGTPLTTAYWMTKQPDNFKEEEHCGEIHNNNNVLNWNDMLCATKLNWICEQET
ncbi:C-type lectin domain family 4 member E [Esox lucius]|uniref:C-type lectin domain family 4 member E n=1 Tax=Esox lucius TaxID=8010 RepID=UPI0014769FE3|nr:C-type lectin domain family 4 member E [Esox lucius]